MKINMKITVKIYGNLKNYVPVGKNQFELELLPGASLKDVLLHLNIPFDDSHVLLVNGKRADKSSVFRHGDILVIFPEISGG